MTGAGTVRQQKNPFGISERVFEKDLRERARLVERVAGAAEDVAHFVADEFFDAGACRG